MALHHLNTACPPVVAELEAIFEQLPDFELLARLRGPKRRGPKGHDVRALWHGYLTLYYLGLPSVSDLVRTLRDNPYIAQACGFDAVPSQPTFSRFLARLAKPKMAMEVKKVMRRMVRRCFDQLPGFGELVALDSTSIKAWANGAKKNRKGQNADVDAGWSIKKGTEGRTKFTFGFKAHLLCDANYELPISVDVSAGHVHDVTRASPLLRQGTATDRRFWPKYVLADAGYSSDALRYAIRHNHAATPIIDPNKSHKKAFRATDKTDDWKALYAKRTGVERMFSRLKGHRRLNSIRVRGIRKVTVHVLLSVIALQAQALATGSRVSVRAVA